MQPHEGPRGPRAGDETQRQRVLTRRLALAIIVLVALVAVVVLSRAA